MVNFNCMYNEFQLAYIRCWPTEAAKVYFYRGGKTSMGKMAIGRLTPLTG